MKHMKRVSLITILDNTNYGTYLQALALALSIKKMGYDIEIIDYIRSFCTFKCRLMSIKNPIKWFYNLIWGLPQWEKLRKKDHNFIRRFVPLTSSTYYSCEEIKKKTPIADIYMTGSDQVWNSIHNRGIEKSFFLEFVPKNCKRVSYAASIGVEQFSKEQQTSIVKLLQKYNKITVREKEASLLLASLGLNEIPVVLDPTLLLNKSEWINIAKQYPFQKSESFLLVYSVESEKQNLLIEKYAVELSKKYGWKIYEINYGNFRHKLKFANKHFMQATPDMFLNLMLEADFVIVSSFHGTAFSINFNKQFLTISPERFNSRVENILTICGLKDRLVLDDSKDADDWEPIEYSKVNSILGEERRISKCYLTDMLK